ncbi:MAG: asparagine synthase (glutamine-hydrolyzing) [Bacteroidales bacterium]
MCGFSGIISNREICSESILKSVSAIKHRGPDDTLLFADDAKLYSCDLSTPTFQQKLPSITSKSSSKLYFGFNRLSIVDLSENGMQPFFDEQRNVVFMLNGEVYNYVELRQTFLADEPFQSETDSEVAFRLYLKLGDDFVHHLRGMFSIVLYDFKTKRLKAWRDRLGMKPFYYAFVDGAFVFSSEMKGIFATGLVEKETNYQGLAYSMYLTTCPAPLTIYKNIHSLQAGFQLDFSLENNSVQTINYWHLEYNPAKQDISFAEFETDVELVCRLHQTGDVPKAIMLSGGMDSGLLAYYLGKSDKKLECLNIYAEDHTTDERDFAAVNAVNAGLHLTYLKIPSVPNEEELVDFLTAEEEPNSEPEAALFLSKKARQMGYKVLYNALGPDEIFGGYPYFKTVSKIKKFDFLFRFIPTFVLPQKHQSKFDELKQFGAEGFPMLSRRLFTWEEISDFMEEKGEPIPIHPIQFIQNQVVEIYPEFKQMPLLKRVSYLEIFYYIASHHTFRSDQPSMRYSIEMRFPFLDHLFLQKYFNESTIFDNLNHHLKPKFREFALKVLPPRIFEMKKRGFSMPVDLWLKEEPNSDKNMHLLSVQKKWYLKMYNLISL